MLQFRKLNLLLVVLVCTLNPQIVFAFKGWIDPDTSADQYSAKSFSADSNQEYSYSYSLIMSDEFNRPGRQFKDGDDPMWTGIDKSDDDQTASGKKSLQYYNSSMITTENGNLVINTNTEDTKWKGWNPYMKKYEIMSRHFKSGMLQGWNKFCFTGGIIEMEVQFPGRSDVGGLWPAVWLLGNLGRATFETSTNLMWPWSYSKCNRDLQHAQEISGCDITTHYSMQEGRGRGATEIDIIEVMPGPSGKLPFLKNNVQRPYTAMTLQIAPGIPASKKRPPAGALPEWGFHWYKNLSYGQNVSINPFFYGTYLASTNTLEPVTRSKAESYQCDAIGSMMTLNDSYWNSMHKFRLEWQPGEKGYVRWYIDGEFKFGIDAPSLEAEGTEIPNEPSYLIINTAISTSWGFPNAPWGCSSYDCKDPESQCGFNAGFCKSLPAKFAVNYVRVYQNKNDPKQTVGCNPKGYPTTKFIQGHEFRYKLLTDVHAIKPIVTGGGECVDDAGCGEGVCDIKKCKCNADWMGPRCLVPTYANDFDDWEKEESIPVFLPFVPSFLEAFSLLALSLLAAATLLICTKRRTLNGTGLTTVPTWL